MCNYAPGFLSVISPLPTPPFSARRPYSLHYTPVLTFIKTKNAYSSLQTWSLFGVPWNYLKLNLSILIFHACINFNSALYFFGSLFHTSLISGREDGSPSQHSFSNCWKAFGQWGSSGGRSPPIWWLIGRSIHGLAVDWLFHWLSSCLIGWLINCSSHINWLIQSSR